MTAGSKLKVISYIALIFAAKTTSAHTALQTNTVAEGTRLYNNIVIGHGCGQSASQQNPNPTKYPVIAQSVVFPDGVDSVITRSDEGEAGSLSDYVTNWGNRVQAIQSGDVFDKNTVLEKTDAGGNVVGFSYRGGKLPSTIHGLIPFRTDAITINPASCATSVTFKIAIADICRTSPISKFNDDVVQFWTPDKNVTGSKFGKAGEDESASLTITRTSSLPQGCTPYTVTVTPSGTQLDRDMPIPKYWGNR